MKYVNPPNYDHWNAFLGVLYTIKGIINYKVRSSGYPHVLKGYSNTNWIYCIDEIKSTSGYVFSLLLLL